MKLSRNFLIGWVLYSFIVTLVLMVKLEAKPQHRVTPVTVRDAFAHFDSMPSVSLTDSGKVEFYNLSDSASAIKLILKRYLEETQHSADLRFRLDSATGFENLFSRL